MKITITLDMNDKSLSDNTDIKYYHIKDNTNEETYDEDVEETYDEKYSENDSLNQISKTINSLNERKLMNFVFLLDDEIAKEISNWIIFYGKNK